MVTRRDKRSRGAWWFAAGAALVIGLVVMASSNSVFAKKYVYPEAMKQDVVDNYHGTQVADPYRWLEDPDSKDTMDWVAKENELTRSYIDSYAKRDAIEQRLTKLWNYPKYGLPNKQGDRYFFSKNDGLQNQSVLYVQKSLDGEAKVVIDPNTLSADGTVALSGTNYTKDGTMMTYAVSASGSDWQEVKVRDIDSGKDNGDVLKWCRFSGIGWKKDKSGFWYNRFPAEGEVPEEDRSNYNKVYWHKLGTPQSEDVLVYEDKANKELGFSPYVTEDGDYLVLYVYHGTDPKNGIYYRKTDGTGDWVKLIEHGTAMFTPIDNIGTTWYFHTDLDASRGRVFTMDITKPAKENWKEIIPQKTEVIDNVTMVNNELVVAYLKDARHQLMIFSKEGKMRREIELPTIGTVGGVSGDREDTEMFFAFTSYTYPTTSFRYDFKTDKVEVFRKPEVDFDGSQFETKQVFYPSKDGTKIPMFITHKKGVKLDGSNPTLLYGYGGFNISMTPTFSIGRVMWLENGGVYAVACLRGGNEYGEEWHQQGVLDRKQNVFDDFIAAGEYLIKEKYTQTKLLAINGGSNGGLLTAACMVQRPDLFGAVVCQVPVIDMLRYHKFTVGRYWVSDYGNAEENAKDFAYMIKYSPLHNVKPGYKSPPVLITSADTDDRVVPAHAKKFAATLQANDAGDNPILIRIETKAGHGAGKPTSKQIEEAADIYSFLFKTLNVKPLTV
ncbi:MAG TPA: prolyl oligopeptidase family serine peptidase [Candidatus Krumholzibacteria bacterium]|nr:prolyl oligopeptidase family serine peptidase [Candidatus Krumholzibacteria bacterium]